MELEEMIARRRRIRKFETKPVEKVKLEKLIEAARLCQSKKTPVLTVYDFRRQAERSDLQGSASAI